MMDPKEHFHQVLEDVFTNLVAQEYFLCVDIGPESFLYLSLQRGMERNIYV